MQSIEFKAELREIALARKQCRLIDAQHLGVLQQRDTYFKMADGRLKRREAPGEPVEWIFYHRPDRVSPKMCNYTILSDAQAQRRWGVQSLHEWLQVIKTRELWMIENVRIHLDHVERLGNFIEFEAMVTKECDVQECHLAVGELREEYGPLLGEPIAVSYADLMEQLLAESS